jgi:hypothetical protein
MDDDVVTEAGLEIDLELGVDAQGAGFGLPLEIVSSPIP